MNQLVEPKDLFAVLERLANNRYITQKEFRNIVKYILYGDETLE